MSQRPAKRLFYVYAALSLAFAQAGTIFAHEGDSHPHAAAVIPVPLPDVTEESGPIAIAASDASASARTSGRGFWTFAAVTNEVLPVPSAARPHLKGAHGTLVVDTERDIVYWGLARVGWIAFKSKLTSSEIIQGNPSLASGNLHGADLLRRPGQLPLVAAADDVEGEVYISDTGFREVRKLEWPQGGSYQSKSDYKPTDVAFTSGAELFVTDGYGRAHFMPIKTDPLQYAGEFLGGKKDSQTPHGITYDSGAGSLLVSARPEGQIRTWQIDKKRWTAIDGLPPGSTVCDVDLWGDYALMPCLNGPDQAPGPIYVVNRKKKAIVSVIRPKEDLGFTDAQHIHDAAWYVPSAGDAKELYIVFTSWNPGGIGAVKLVGRPK